MNELIESIFADFTVDGVKIPVKYLFYNGHGETYIVYFNQDKDNSLTGDNELIGYADYYDFDVYSKENYSNVVKEMKRRLKENGFVWQPSRSGIDMFEPQTGYYHKTFNFAILREE